MKQRWPNCDPSCGSQPNPGSSSHQFFGPLYSRVFETIIPCGSSSRLKIVLEADSESLRASTSPPAVKVSYIPKRNPGPVDTITAVISVTVDKPEPSTGLAPSNQGQGYHSLLARVDIGSAQNLTKGSAMDSHNLNSKGAQGLRTCTPGLRNPDPLDSVDIDLTGHGYPSAARGIQRPNSQEPSQLGHGSPKIPWKELQERFECLAIRAESAQKSESRTQQSQFAPSDEHVSASNNNRCDNNGELFADGNYWKWDQETGRFRHWDVDDEEWVYYPVEFD